MPPITPTSPTPNAPATAQTASTTLKLFSWNINGLRAVLKKGALTEFLDATHPDLLCLQEIKAKPGQATLDLPEYLELWNSAERPGYSGTAVFSKFQPLSVHNGFPDSIVQAYDWQPDRYGSLLTEGRIQTLEFQPFYLVNVYVPNSKRDLSRLQLREQLWDPALLRFLQLLDTHKPVVICGDFNAAHTPLDLARPKDNEHNAGFTPEERQGIKNLLSAGFVDSFRYFYPSIQRYTWWSHWSHARERNIGWRIDYFFVSSRLLPNLKSADIYEQFLGSDHCPVGITLEF